MMTGLQWLTWLTSVLASAIAVPAIAAPPCTLDRASGTTIDAEPFMRKGYGLRWSAATQRIAFMQPDARGYYRVFTMRPDGSELREVTKGAREVPDKHQGAPYWHPSGRYLLFVAQKAAWQGRSLFGVPDYEALPGFGRHDDLWIIAADGERAWPLISDDNTKDQGILVPVFSPDGKLIAWSERQPGGKYRLRVADFVETPEPHLDNVRTFQPGGGSYYETGSFSSDSRSLTYTSDQDTHSFWRGQIYRLDLADGTSTRLTIGADYNEHPSVVSTPTGDWVVYMSTRGVDRYAWQWFLGTDWYAVRLDGTARKRLTTMNINRKDNPQNSGKMLVAGTVAISPNGDFMLGDVQDSLTKQSGLVRSIRFVCAEH